MSASNSFETAVLNLYFNNTNHANVGDATGVRGSTTAGSFYIALYTADPGETGTAVTNETAYTNYARVAMARSGAGFTVAGNSASNAAVVTFPTCYPELCYWRSDRDCGLTWLFINPPSASLVSTPQIKF
jgi:hypothetical protein